MAGTPGGTHLWTIIARIAEILEQLKVDVAANSPHETVNRERYQPAIQARKRRSGSGREDDQDTMRIEEGITIVPLEPVRSMGTNERDGIAYKFWIAIAVGVDTDIIDETWAQPIWEQAIRQRFQNKRMGGVELLSGCEVRNTVEPGELPNWARLADRVEATFLTLSTYVRECRID